jgi:GT2 family glycosyltransferase
MAGVSFSFILVNYRSAAFIRPWFDSLRKLALDASEYEIILVNNDASEQDRLDTLAQELPLRIIHLPENVGFGAAVNRGAAQAQGEFLFLCNPDTQFLSGDFAQLQQLFHRQPALGIVGMQLLDIQRHTELFSVGKAITLWQLLRNHSPWRALMPTIQQLVERVSGGALCIPRILFHQLNGFDEQFFLYFEDAALCQRALELKRRILFFPAIQLIHHSGASMPSKERQKTWYRQSRALYLHKHRPWIEFQIVRIFSFLFE